METHIALSALPACFRLIKDGHCLLQLFFDLSEFCESFGLSIRCFLDMRPSDRRAVSVGDGETRDRALKCDIIQCV